MCDRSTLVPLYESLNEQNGDDDPCETIIFDPEPGASYGFVIEKYSGVSKNIHVNFLSQNKLDYSVSATSLLIPADNPNVISVGAVPWYNPSVIEDFSSQGPTTDGRIKPDVVAPDEVLTLSYGSGGFSGTCASCPHVAGTCALAKQACPACTPSRIKLFLESNADDLGASGKDNVFGSGFLILAPYNPGLFKMKTMPWLLPLLRLLLFKIYQA